MLALVPADARRVLDVGCAEGALGARLLERGVGEVFGIEYDPEVGARARASRRSIAVTSRPWICRLRFTKHEIGSLFDQAGLTVTSLGANIDPDYDEVRQSLAGKPLVDFAFGRVALKDLRQEEVVELFVIQYLITATKR